MKEWPGTEGISFSHGLFTLSWAENNGRELLFLGIEQRPSFFCPEELNKPCEKDIPCALAAPSLFHVIIRVHNHLGKMLLFGTTADDSLLSWWIRHFKLLLDTQNGLTMKCTPVINQ